MLHHRGFFSLLFLVVTFCNNNLVLASPLVPITAPHVTSNNMDLGPHQFYTEVHLISNGSNSASGGAPTVQCNNGYLETLPTYLSGTKWFYTCTVLLNSAYDLTHPPFSSEASGTGGFGSNWGWAAVPNSNYNETASMVCMNGTCPKTSITVSGCMGFGSHFANASGYDANGYYDAFNGVTVTLYTSGGTQIATGYSNHATDASCGETNATLTANLTIGQNITVKKVSTIASSGKTLTCTGSYVVLPTDVGNQIWMDCCINGNTALNNTNFNNVTIGSGSYTASIVSAVNNAEPCFMSSSY